MKQQKDYSVSLQLAHPDPRRASARGAHDRAPRNLWEPWDYVTWSAALKAAQAGNPRTTDRLAEWLFGWAVRHVSRLRVPSREDREEIAVWYAAYLTRHRLCHLRDVGEAAWEQCLFTSLWHVMVKWWKRDAQYLRHETREADLHDATDEKKPLHLEDLLPDPVSPEETYLRQADRDQVWRAIERLEEEDRLLLILRFWEGLTVEEIARALRKKRGTVAKRLHDLLGLLRKWMTGPEA